MGLVKSGEAGEVYKVAARKACDYLLREHVALDEYRGGTLDNPNVVDKEAAMLTMVALLSMYEQSGRRTKDRDTYLRGAERAAKLAVTWNSIWNVPLVPGTRLEGAHVRSTGWGGINSIWGAGVTDIYSLFFLAEFVRMSTAHGRRVIRKRGRTRCLWHPTDPLVPRRPVRLRGYRNAAGRHCLL